MRKISCGETGFTLVELVIFIVVVGILAVGVFAAFAGALSDAARPGALTQATELAQGRMELILAHKRMAPDYATFLASPDPCAGGSPPAICTPPPGFAFNPMPSVAAWPTDNTHDEIVVTVEGPGDAELRVLVADY